MTTPQAYQQYKAMLAITKASLKAIFRSPSAVGFSVGFPLVFLFVFGSIGDSGPSVNIALANPADSNAYPIRSLLHFPMIHRADEKDSAALRKDLEKGRIAAILSLDSTPSPAGFMQYTIRTQTSSASGDKYPILRMAMALTIENIEDRKMPSQYRPVTVKELPVLPGRAFTMIDFILPGMLGFSLLSAAIFGVAFVFFNLRQQLVLKRFYATPIAKTYIVLGECLARVLFQLITAVVIIAAGVLVFHFTLVHGWITFFEMVALSLFGLIIFMGCGFIVSSVARTESTIPLFANILTLPQFLLSGTFFSTDVFPPWLQKVCEALPLKQLNDALRHIAFEGARLVDCGKQIGILAIWGVIVYAIAIKLFKWE
jgi:ABC-2 type transport system permease protein